jgi:hypothetical protein
MCTIWLLQKFTVTCEVHSLSELSRKLFP